MAFVIAAGKEAIEIITIRYAQKSLRFQAN